MTDQEGLAEAIAYIHRRIDLGLREFSALQLRAAVASLKHGIGVDVVLHFEPNEKDYADVQYTPGSLRQLYAAERLR